MHYNFDEIINREKTGSVKYDLRERIFGDEKVLPLWVADMDFRTPDFIMGALQKRLEHEILGYTLVPPSFYQSVADWNKRRHNWMIKSEWISFSPGVVPALNLLVMAFTQPGDGIIIQPPVYFPFFTAVENHGRRLIANPLRYEQGRYEMDFRDLESKIDKGTRMLILCSPHNPTGNVWSPEVLRRIGEICIRNKMLLVSDEIHSDLVFTGFRHTPAASISEDIAGITITCMSPSKTFNLAGLSTAYLIIPDAGLRKKYETLLDHVHVGSGNIFGFIAAEAAYGKGEEWLKQLMAYLEGNLMFLRDFLAKHLPMIGVVSPEATYLTWLDCSKLGMSPGSLRSFMIQEAGLGLNDGPQFGKEGEGFQRINIACPRRILYEALVKMHTAVKNYFAK
ncbi:MAG: PatB family C-S lyase [Bacteroidales bacterium]|nr:PatB family C-S lyase [Bacteroidales bacterium]